MTSGIYAIKNTVTGKYYIGSTNNFEKRWKMHKYHLKRGTHHSFKLQRSHDKHGLEAFEFLILREVEELGLLDDIEEEFIELYRSWSNGYNILRKRTAKSFDSENLVGRLTRTIKRAGRDKEDKIQRHYRVERSTSKRLNEIAIQLGYVYGKTAGVGAMLDDIANGTLLVVPNPEKQ